MKLIKVTKNEDNLFSSHILGDPVVNESLADYEFPGFSAFFAQIRLDEYNVGSMREGMIYIFFDLSGYYSDEFGEYSLVPMLYYTKENMKYIFDDFNEENQDIEGINDMFMLDDGNGFDIYDDRIEITDGELLKLFLNFDNDIKKIIISFDKLKENSFNEGYFRIIK